MWSINRLNYTWEFMLTNPKGFSEGIYKTEIEAKRARKLYKAAYR